MSNPCNRIDAIPEDLKNVLTKFAIEYLTLKPPNIVDFGSQFFANIAQSPSSEVSRQSSLSLDLKRSVSRLTDGSETSTVDDVENYCKSGSQSAHLYNALLKTDYFKDHNDDGLFKAINQMYSVSIEAGERVQLKADGTQYVIECGALNITTDDSHEQIDETFGCFSLMHLKWKFGQCELEIFSESDTIMWVLDGSIFQQCWFGDIHAHCRDYEWILVSSPIFSRLVDPERQLLADVMITKRFEAGDVIYDAADGKNAAAGCFFIQEGLVTLATNDEDGGVQTVLLKCGQHFGEIHCKDEMILKSATALTKVRCAYLSASAVQELIRHPFSKIRPNLCSQCKNEF